MNDIGAMQTSFRLLRGNRDQLVIIIKRVQDPSIVNESPGGLQGDVVDLMMNEVLRCLYNFLAMAFALVDQARVHFRHLYGGSYFKKEIQAEIIRRFPNDPDHIVAKGLRNFVLHYRVTPVKTS